MARVYVLKETTDDKAGDWQLFLQWCRFDIDDGILFGYRFIWRREDGSLQAARGQARIPSIKVANTLMAKAVDAGWGNRDGVEMEKAVKLLEENGCVVTLTSGYVGWPDKASALKGHLTPEMIKAEQIIREWS